MNIKGEWAEPCKECGALDGCCATAQTRLEIATDLAQLVHRQSETITKLKQDLQEARQVAADLRRAQAVA